MRSVTEQTALLFVSQYTPGYSARSDSDNGRIPAPGQDGQQPQQKSSE